MEFHIDGNNCYMTDGKIASLLFGIKILTEVILTYNEHNTTITMRNSSNEPENIILPFQDNTYTLHPYENDQLFGWEYKVSQAMASETKNQVLVSHILNNHTLLYTLLLLLIMILCSKHVSAYRQILVKVYSEEGTPLQSKHKPTWMDAGGPSILIQEIMEGRKDHLPKDGMHLREQTTLPKEINCNSKFLIQLML
jgi:hypothetical protein